MNWTKEQVMELIGMLRSSTSLWDYSSQEYRDKNRKYQELLHMASHFQTSTDEISRKLRSLKTQYYRERKRIKERSQNGTKQISNENIWFGYAMLKFLYEKNAISDGRNIMEGNDVNVISEDENLNVSTPEQIEEIKSDDGGDVFRSDPPYKPDSMFAPSKTTIPRTKAHFHKSQSIRLPANAGEFIRKKRHKISKMDVRVDEAYQFLRNIQDDVKSNDSFTIYGENVASRLRGANQNSRAISIAKNRIDNILFQLEMGEFSYSRDDTRQAASSSRASPAFSNISRSPNPYSPQNL